METGHIGWAQKSICGIDGKPLAHSAVWESCTAFLKGGEAQGK